MLRPPLPRTHCARSGQSAQVGAAKRNGEFIARLAAKRPGLHKADVMGLRRAPLAQQAGLQRDELEVLAIAVPILGFGARPALVALALYGFMPILANTIAGLDAVPGPARGA